MAWSSSGLTSGPFAGGPIKVGFGELNDPPIVTTVVDAHQKLLASLAAWERILARVSGLRTGGSTQDSGF